MTVENEELPGDVGNEDTTEGAEPSARDAQLAFEDDAAAAAVAVLSAARKEVAEEETPAPADDAHGDELAATAPTEPTIPAKVETPDAKAELLLARLNAAEANARAQSAEIKELRSAVARTKSLEAAIAKANEGDASELFEQHLRWKPDTVLKYVEKGKEGIADIVAERKVDAVQERITALEQQLETERAQNTVREYKATISREITPVSKEVPFLVNFHTDPDTGVVDQAALADAVFDFQCRLHQANREVSIDEAAKALNKAHEVQFKRLQGKPASSPKTAEAPATSSATPAKQPAPVVKKPRVPLPASSGKDRDLEDALAALKSYKAARRSEADGLE